MLLRNMASFFYEQRPGKGRQTLPRNKSYSIASCPARASCTLPGTDRSDWFRVVSEYEVISILDPETPISS